MLPQREEDRLHNYQRSHENLFDAAKEVTEGNTEIISYIEGVNFFNI